jgi:hypothetical protein
MTGLKRGMGWSAKASGRHLLNQGSPITQDNKIVSKVNDN